jgi:hypothetical protein
VKGGFIIAGLAATLALVFAALSKSGGSSTAETPETPLAPKPTNTPKPGLVPEVQSADSFVQAKNYDVGRPFGPPNLIVLHSMEAPEKLTTAENIAGWFGGPDAPHTSPTFCADVNSIIQCVKLGDRARHAAGANDRSIGIEMAGYAKQTDGEWHDTYSSEMLSRVASLVAELCEKFNISPTLATVEDLRAGKGGITTHANVSKAFGKSTHWDPGPSFPMEEFLDMVRARMASA